MKGGENMSEVIGIIRRIDDLGRIVIPNEVRKRLKIEPGTKMEMISYSDGTITFKKVEG